jgi:ribosomal protein L6P/L9E
MSRIAKTPIELPSGVELNVQGGEVKVKGPKGNLAIRLHPRVSLEQDDKNFVVKPANDSDVPMAGTFRSLVNNMVIGVTDGFEKKLTLVGVGYRAQVAGKKLSRAATSRKLARSLRKSGRSVRQSLTKARVFVIQTSAWCGKKPRKLKRIQRWTRKRPHVCAGRKKPALTFAASASPG